MSKETAVLVLGIWIMVVPYLGIPSSWKVLFFILSGLAVMILGFSLRAEALARASGQGMGADSSRRTFIENMPTSQATHPPFTQDQQGYEHKERINSLN